MLYSCSKLFIWWWTYSRLIHSDSAVVCIWIIFFSFLMLWNLHGFNAYKLDEHEHTRLYISLIDMWNGKNSNWKILYLHWLLVWWEYRHLGCVGIKWMKTVSPRTKSTSHQPNILWNLDIQHTTYTCTLYSAQIHIQTYNRKT